MILIQAPILSESGYGHKAREISYAIFKEFGNDVKILPTNWGNNVNTGLKNSKFKELESTILSNPQLNQQPDLFIVIGVPEDMRQLIGKKNILFTSGVEVDKISPEWIDALNKSNLDLIIVPSEFVKNVFLNTEYTHNQDPSQKLRLHKQVEVIPESYDERIFNQLTNDDKKILAQFNKSLEDNGIDKFVFTSGQVSPDKLESGGDRKGFRDLYIAFKEQFKSTDKIALVAKLNGLNSSYMTDYLFKKAISVVDLEIKSKDNAPLLVLSGHLSPQFLFALLSHEKNIANIYPTKGEGFGRMILDAVLSNKPLVVPEVGAFRDFTVGCENVTYVKGSFKDIPPSAFMGKILVHGSKWYEINIETLKGLLKSINRLGNNFDYSENLPNIENIKTKFGYESVSKQITNVIANYHAKQLQIKLPNLKSLNIKKEE